MKNKIYILLITVIFIIYTGCNKNAANSDNNSASYKVGIAVINNHPALLEIEKGIIDELKAQNMNVLIDSQNANNDANIINAITNITNTYFKKLYFFIINSFLKITINVYFILIILFYIIFHFYAIYNIIKIK